jgi:hypothetical protein
MNRHENRISSRVMQRLLLGAGMLLAMPACLMFSDRAGVPVTAAMAERIHVGNTTRDEVLAIVGAPTGTYDTDLLATVTRSGQTFEAPSALQAIHPDIYTWQQIDVRAQVAFFPVLFAWSTARITSRTLMVIFDEHGIVSDKAYREDKR